MALPLAIPEPRGTPARGRGLAIRHAPGQVRATCGWIVLRVAQLRLESAVGDVIHDLQVLEDLPALIRLEERTDDPVLLAPVAELVADVVVADDAGLERPGPGTSRLRKPKLLR